MAPELWSVVCRAEDDGSWPSKGRHGELREKSPRTLVPGVMLALTCQLDDG